MPRCELLIIVAALSVPLTISPVLAGNCRSDIMTVETVLVRLSDAGGGGELSDSSGSPLRKIDVPSARQHLLEAKARLEEGLEMECELQIIEAMKRLGVRD